MKIELRPYGTFHDGTDLYALLRADAHGKSTLGYDSYTGEGTLPGAFLDALRKAESSFQSKVIAVASSAIRDAEPVVREVALMHMERCPDASFVSEMTAAMTADPKAYVGVKAPNGAGHATLLTRLLEAFRRNADSDRAGSEALFKAVEPYLSLDEARDHELALLTLYRPAAAVAKLPGALEDATPIKILGFLLTLAAECRPAAGEAIKRSPRVLATAKEVIADECALNGEYMAEIAVGFGLDS